MLAIDIPPQADDAHRNAAMALWNARNIEIGVVENAARAALLNIETDHVALIKQTLLANSVIEHAGLRRDAIEAELRRSFPNWVHDV